MPSTSLERDRIARLVEAAGERLTGDWILLGDALAALSFSPGRVTEDIDMVWMASDPEHRWQLLDSAISKACP